MSDLFFTALKKETIIMVRLSLLVLKSNVTATDIRNRLTSRTLHFNAAYSTTSIFESSQTRSNYWYATTFRSVPSSICRKSVRSLDFQSPFSICLKRTLSAKVTSGSKPILNDGIDQSTTSSASIDSESKIDDDSVLGVVSPTANASNNTKNSAEESSWPLVYESPLGNVISKLRTVSLCTAIIGMTGVPFMIALKGGTIPETGILAAALLFVSGSIGSTAAIHFVFSPYVYKIEQIPIRVCSTPPTTNIEVDDCSNKQTTIPIDNETTTTLKAWTRTLFLRNDSITFDPTIDVQPYKGFRPMSNFVVKGRPLYVHSEYVYDTKLRLAMNLEKSSATVVSKANPDDDLF